MSTGSQLYLTIGDLLRQHRIDADLSVPQLQELSGVHRTTIARIENGEIKRSEYATIQNIAKSLNTPYEVTVEHYICVVPRIDILLSILEEVISLGSASLASKIAIKYLESPNEDSFDAIEKLYDITTTCKAEPALKYLLFQTIIDYSRDHGVMLYLAKGQLQSYFIERNDFTRLESTYQYGKHILNYKNFLSHDEKILLYYKLAVHAYSLTRYDECKHYYNKYITFKFAGSAEKHRVANALVESKVGNTAFAKIELTACLQDAADNNFIHIVTGLLEIHLQNDDIAAAQKLFSYDDKIQGIVFLTPMVGAEIARYYRIKGHVLSALAEFDCAVDAYLTSVEKYTYISKREEAFDSFHHVTELLLNNNELIGVETIRKINSVCAALRKKEELI
ncbi:helix-turn-helix domain-containing protein [Paenibacillus sp. 481]|uniref:helix-turn-helix domain-containing protein n=1 Tax=Paenibacillus sp. 481 TaxID=2835869 RepID=UPI001E61235B|nr:helix-turn-helix transcriptional regulator [Paenibacillus sp. 481]UHA75076.1 transcriptional regulator [Paenibacillus sp. 481]